MMHALNDSVLHDLHTTVHPGLHPSIISADSPNGKYDPSPWNCEMVSVTLGHKQQKQF